MKRIGKKVLALVLSLIMCLSLLPTSVFATYGTLSEDGTSVTEGQPSGEMVTTEWGQIPADWHGYVMRYSYDDSTEQIKIDVGLFNAPYGSLFESFLKFDFSKVEIVSTDGKRLGLNNALSYYNMTDEFLNASGTSDTSPFADTPLIPSGDYTIFDGVDSSSSKVNNATGELIVTAILKTPDAINDTEAQYPLSQDFPNFLNAEYTNAKFPEGMLVPFYYVTFKLKSGVTIDNITPDTFGWGNNASIPETSHGADVKNGDGEFVATGVYTIGFPEPEPAKGAVKVTTDATGAGVTVSGLTATLTKGSDSYECVYEDNAYVFKNVPVANGYRLEVSGSGTGSDGKAYKMTSTYTNAGVNVVENTETSNTTSVTVSNTYFQEVKDEYTFNLSLARKDGTLMDMSGATVKLDGVQVWPEAGVPAMAADAVTEVPITTALTGDHTMEISGLVGYQPTTLKVTLTGSNSVITDLTSETAGAVTGGGGSYTVKMTAAQTTTNVNIPLPVPEGMTEEAANELAITAKPAEGVTGSDIPATGETLDTKVTLTKDEGGNITGVEVSADFPDGAYEVEIGGNGLEPAKTTVTVSTVRDENGNVIERVVNVGGFPTIEDGKVDSVTGGVTVITKPETGENGGSDNGKADLGTSSENNTIYDAGTDGKTEIGGAGGTGNTTVNNAEGTPITGTTDGSGLLETDSPVLGDLVTNVDGSAQYYVVVEPKTADTNGQYKSFEAKVYLKNTKGYSGAFGMYFDPKVFGDSTQATNDGIKLDVNAANNIQLSATSDSQPAASPRDYEIEPNYNGNGYVVFNWQVKNGAEALDGTTGTGALVATITLPVKAQYWAEADLAQVVDNHSIFTMAYNQTKGGEAIIQKVDAENPDPDYRDEALAAQMGSIWRALGKDYVTPPENQLPDSKATRGGFYQYYTDYAPASDPVVQLMAEAHDIAMVFDLPEIFSKQRVDFWATEPGADASSMGAGIDNAYIFISADATKLPTTDTACAELVDENSAALTADGFVVLEDGVIILKTANGGHVHTTQEVGTYYFTAYESSHWTYPNGASDTDSDNCAYAAYQVTDSGVVIIEGDNSVKVPYNSDCINPQMNPKTFHKVELEKETTDTDTLEVKLTSPATAYNNVKYYFTVEPNAGWTWNETDYADMDALAAAMGVTIYGVDATASNVTDAFRNTDGEKTFTVKWDATREMFYIDGTIEGEAIGVDTIGGTAVEKLRAGDVVITIPTDSVKKAQYKITATTGNGGTLNYTASTETPASTFVTNPTSSADGKYTSVVETLGEGVMTSATYTFTPDGTNKIDKVVINGVEQTITDQQKENGYSYQFTNISSDQNIHVTFVDKDNNPLSDPYVTITVGTNGAVDVSATKGGTDVDLNGAETGNGDTVPGGDTGIYEADMDKMTLVIKPDNSAGTGTGATQYEVDTLLIGDAKIDPADNTTWPEGVTVTKNSNGTWNVDIPLKPGDNESVVVTFKDINGPSTQAIVTAKVVDGFGTLTPVGVKIYPIGSTPSFTLAPDDGWKVVNTSSVDKAGSVSVDGVDRSTGITIDSSTGVGTYTLPALTGDVTVEVTFFENTVKVKGSIQIQKGSGPAVAAKLVFVRAAVDGKTDKTTVNVTSGNNVTSSLLSFEADIPAGEWTVTVYKQGYLYYTITGFEVKADAKHDIVFGTSCDGTEGSHTENTPKPIVLIAGDAYGDGITVERRDVATVVGGWINGATALNQTKGNIDEDTAVTTDDMALVQQNMYKTRTTTTYSNFKAST